MKLLTWRRATDIYIAAVSHAHAVCAPNVYVAIVSTIVETSVPEREILPGLQLLGTIVDKYVLLFFITTFGSRPRS
jgi:Rab GDP dissociation inhibitor